MSSSSSTSSELIFSQLRSVGIAVNPQWDISTLTSDVIYGLCYDASKVTVIPPLESADPTGAKRRAFEAIRTADNDLLQLFADKGLPGRLPMSMRDRFSTCQTLCDAMRLALGVETDYTAIMYPDAPKTKQLLQAVARAVGEHADALAAAIAEAEDANTTGHDDAEDEVPTAASATKRGMALLRRMCEQFTPSTATFRVPDATWTPGTAECQPVVAFEAVELTPAGDDGETTLLMSCPSQRQALPSLVEYVAAQRVGTKPFESLRKRRLTRDAVKKSGATAQSSRNVASVEPPLAPEQPKTCDSLFFGTALALDPTVAEQRRIEAEELAAAQQAHNEDVEALESEVAQQKEQREADEETIEAKISEVKSQIAEYKALAKAAKAAIKQHQRTIEELDENREASAADRARRQQLAEELQNLIVEAANPATLEALTAKYEALVAERETQRAEFESKLSKTVKKLTKLKAMAELNKGDQSEAVAVLKAECKHLRKSIRMSHVEAANLARDWDRCPKEVDRSKYARLVTDMSSSLRRQQTQIDGVTAEQRESMAACGKVRAETKVVFDEVEAHVYDHAKREAFAKDAYAGIIKLREAYTSLVSAIERRGEIKREQHVLDARHAKLVKSVQYFEEADASINEDLNTIRAEIQELQSKIKDWQHAAAATPADE